MRRYGIWWEDLIHMILKEWKMILRYINYIQMGKHMSFTLPVSKDISVIRVVFEFYPIIGGSASHVMELSKKINPYLKNQILIAPKFSEDCGNFDLHFGPKVLRARFHSPTKTSILPVIPLVYISYSLSVYFALKKMTHPNIIHAHGIFNIVFCSIIGKYMGIPVVGMLHGSITAYSKIHGFFESFLATLIKPDHCLVLDDGSSAPDKFRKIWKNKVTIVHHGIDTEFYKPMEKDKELISKLGLNKFNFVILSTSSLIPVKNIDLAIKSFRKFIDMNVVTNACLLIAGNGSIKEDLIKLTNSMGLNENVLFLGSVSKEDILKYISISDIVIATSLYSNMNRSVQEAMSCGKPVVVFDSGSIWQLIKQKENGILVKSGDLNSFAENIKLLYENIELRNFLGNQARETILKERSWDKRIQQELSVYNHVLRGKIKPGESYFEF
jgi:L-malate glycosyltransferase